MLPSLENSGFFVSDDGQVPKNSIYSFLIFSCLDYLVSYELFHSGLFCFCVVNFRGTQQCLAISSTVHNNWSLKSVCFIEVCNCTEMKTFDSTD